MRFRYLFLLLFAVIGLSLSAQYKSGYYDAMNGKSKEALKAAAKTCVANHTQLDYSDLPTQWEYSDVYPDLVNGQKRWWEMYSNNVYLIGKNQTAKQSFSSNGMQREHSVPKSWWKKDGSVEYTPAYSDMWNLYPSDGPANQAKLNYPFGEVSNPNAESTYSNGSCLVGSAKSGQGGGSGVVFEPADEYKGDFARTCFYMAVVYDDLPWVINYMFSQNTYPTLQQWAINMLLQWSRMDTVSQKEIDRNNAVEGRQGNRNPFIDFPELAEYIWGTRTSETFYVSEQDGQVTPPITGDPELTSPISGESVDFGEVVVANSVKKSILIKGSNLTGPLSVRVVGTDRALFVPAVTSIPASDINTGSNYYLEITYTPTRPGSHEASLMIYDGGLDISDNITIPLTAVAYIKPDLSTLTAYEASNVSDNSYVANWSVAPETIDCYVVTRITYPESGPEMEQYTSVSNSMEIVNRNPLVTETYYVQSSRIGYLSEPSNTITVAANTSVMGVEAYQPLTIGSMEGGFVVMLDEEHTNMRVYDLTGRIVTSLPSVSGGEMISLPRGIYVVTTDQSSHPQKVMVR
jgi:endonuclease I